MFGLMQQKVHNRKMAVVACNSFLDGVKAGLAVAMVLIGIFLIFCIPSEAQFSWPTYPVNAPIGIYKAMVDNGSGIAVQAVGDTEPFIGVTQQAVVTSHGTVPLAIDGASQMQVGTAPVIMGELVTSNSFGNAVAFAPAGDGQLHCALGTVVGGNVAARGFIYVRITQVCFETPTPSTGAVTSVFGRTGVVIAVTGDYSVSMVTGAAPLASPAFTGAPTAPTPSTADNSTKIATTAYVQNQGYITAGTEAVTSVFGRTGAVVATSGDYAVGQVTGAAPLASPALTGTPTAPTGAGSSTQIATQAFVLGQGFITSAPVTSVFGRTGVVVATSGDYAVGQVTGAAPLASPALTGTPTVPTATVGTNTSQAASTAFVLGQGFLTSSTGANQGLSNLASVAINLGLLPGVTNSIALGSTTLRWSNLFTGAETCGILNTLACIITGNGGTSGSATITWPAVAGTASNPIAFSNAISSASQIVSTGGGLASPNFAAIANTNNGMAINSSTISFGIGGSNDVQISAGATAFAGTVAGKVEAGGYVSVGTKFTSSGGCSETSLVGGASAGQFTAGATACTTVITFGNSQTAPNGWDCNVSDHTTANIFRTTSSNATTATISGVAVLSDVISFHCVGY